LSWFQEPAGGFSLLSGTQEKACPRHRRGPRVIKPVTHVGPPTQCCTRATLRIVTAEACDGEWLAAVRSLLSFSAQSDFLVLSHRSQTGDVFFAASRLETVYSYTTSRGVQLAS